MKRILLFMVLTVIMVAACNENNNGNKKAESSTKKEAYKELSKEELLAEIKYYEKDLFENSNGKINRSKALKLASDYQQYAGRFPDDSLSPEFLFKAADISMNMNVPKQTVAIFTKIINKYPDFDKLETCYFLRAFVYDDQLKEYRIAETYYKEFLQKYPNSDFADDAEMLMKNLGKSPEEFIEGLK